MEYISEDTFFENEIDVGDDAIVEYDITTSPRDLTPANIVDMIDSGIIEIPLFQRNYVWDIKKASKLIESLILDLPVPELFFYIDGDDNSNYKIIDGQQRFLSIYFFVKGRFPKSNSARFMIREGINDGAELDSLLPDNSIFKDFSLHLSDNSTPVSRYDGKKFATLDKLAEKLIVEVVAVGYNDDGRAFKRKTNLITIHRCLRYSTD